MTAAPAYTGALFSEKEDRLETALLYPAIFTRKSVRKYADALPENVVDELRGFAHELAPVAAGIRTEMEVYTDGEVKGYSPAGVAAYTEDTRTGHINAGYMLEQIDLWCNAKGLGSCWLGAARAPRHPSPAGLAYALSVCVGKPAQEPRRRNQTEFRRKPLQEITDVPDPGPVLQAVRLAPSALNRQPWYFAGTNTDLYVYMNKVVIGKNLALCDIGIALLYLRLAGEHAGCTVTIDLEPKDAPSISGRTVQAQVHFQEAAANG